MESFIYIHCLVASLQVLENIDNCIPDRCVEKGILSQKITLYKSHISRNFFEPFDILLRQLDFSDPWFESFIQPLRVECEHLLNSVVIAIVHEFKRIGRLTTRNHTLRELDVRNWRLAVAKKRLLSQFSEYADTIYSLQHDETTRLVEEAFMELETVFRLNLI